MHSTTRVRLRAEHIACSAKTCARVSSRRVWKFVLKRPAVVLAWKKHGQKLNSTLHEIVSSIPTQALSGRLNVVVQKLNARRLDILNSDFWEAHYFAWVAFTVFSFGAAVAIGILFNRETGNAASIWPANGILCAVLLATRSAAQRRVILVLGSIANFGVLSLVGDALATCLAISIINPVEAYLTSILIRRYCTTPLNFSYGQSFLRFSLIAGFFGPVLPSICGAAVVYSAHGGDYFLILRTWFFADALGLLIMVPSLFLLFAHDKVAHNKREQAEIGLLLLALISISTFVFSQSSLPLLFLIPPVIVRIAFRLGPSHTAAAVLIMSSIGIVLSSAGYGPTLLVSASNASERMLVLQIFIVVSFFSAFPAANAFAVQTRMQKELATQISDHDELAKKLHDSKSILKTAIENMSQGLCLYDAQGRVLVTNEAFARIYGLPNDAITPGMTIKQVVKLRIAQGLFAGENPQQYLEERLAPVTAAMHKIHQLNDGRSISISQRPLAGGGWVTTQEDITESRQIERRLAFLAQHDALTGLVNRAVLHERIELALARVRRGEEAAVLFLDLDQFKSVNDTFGHAAGDELLKVIAGRLRSGLRDTDTIARLGGDEFAILLVGSKQPEGANVVAQRIINLVRAPIVIDGHQIQIGTSIGAATAPHDAGTTSGLLKCADLALYKSKSEGRGTHRFFEPTMDTRMLERLKLEQDLRSAIAENGFSLHYQPLVDLNTNEVRGFEALVRWQHAERGMVSPAEFIPLAEETGLIVPIGKWVLNQACKDAATWPSHLNVAVNLSRVQMLSPGIFDSICEVLTDTGLTPQRLQLEITESAVMHDTHKAIMLLNLFRSLGVLIAMDDFGTGYSSLSCLRKFPFNKIKIDRSFIQDISTSPESREILKAIVALANALGMTTTAEGIETAEQLDIVRSEGCDTMQGYFYSRPKPIEEFAHITRLADAIANQAA